MVARITELVPTEDAGDLMRNLVAAILKEESENQVAIAGVSPPADPLDYALSVFVERRDVWATVEDNRSNERVAPVINIWRTTGNANANASTRTNAKVKWGHTFAIDCYGFGRPRSDGAGGQVSGDKDSVLERDRALCLVRQFLCAAGNYLLRNRGQVWRAEFTNTEYFVPAVEEIPAPNVSAVRSYFEVGLTESAPQLETGRLEFLAIDICTIDPQTGEVQLAAEVDLDYTAS